MTEHRVRLRRAALLQPDHPFVAAVLTVFATGRVEVSIDVCLRRPDGLLPAHAAHRLSADRVAAISTIDGELFEIALLDRRSWPDELARVATVDGVVLAAARPPTTRLDDPMEVPVQALTAAPSSPGVNDPAGQLHTTAVGRLRAVVNRAGERASPQLISWVLYADGWRSLGRFSRGGVPMVRFTRVDPPCLGRDVTALAKELEAGT